MCTVDGNERGLIESVRKTDKCRGNEWNERDSGIWRVGEKKRH